MSKSYKRRWRNFLIDNPFQLRMTLSFVLICLLLTGLFGTLFYREVRVSSRVQSTGVPEFDASLQAHFDQEDQRLLVELVVGIVLLTGLLTLASIVKTHHIAGPVLVARKALREMAEGRWPPVRELRQGDEFSALLREVQELATVLRQRGEGLGQRLDGIAGRCQDPETARELQELARELRLPEAPPLPPGTGMERTLS